MQLKGASPDMTKEELDSLAHAAAYRAHVVTSAVAYAVAALERDTAPTFQLGTAMRMGLSDQEVADPVAIDIMRHEYNAWVVGHGLADISESLATFLNELVQVSSAEMGVTQAYTKFERLGLDLKVRELPLLNLDQDYLDAIESITRARNCLIHRHGIVGERDCNAGSSELHLSWRGVRLYSDKGSGLIEIDANHRGGFTRDEHGMIHLRVERVERKYLLGQRLLLPPSDLCTLSWCIQGISGAIHEAAARLLGLPVDKPTA
jgi:hypothetical protein